jgi:hypothetical protein
MVMTMHEERAGCSLGGLATIILQEYGRTANFGWVPKSYLYPVSTSSTSLPVSGQAWLLSLS